MCTLLPLVSLGVPLLVVQIRRRRGAARAARVAAAPAAIRETALFRQAEADLAWRGTPLLLGLGLAAGSLWILAHWPQAALLAPLRPWLAGFALAIGPLLAVRLVRRRRHLINVAYLRWCLADQIGHAERQGVGVVRGDDGPRRGRFAGRRAQERPVPESFVAGGFAWRLDDPSRQHAESVVHLASRGETRRLDLDWTVWPL